MGYVIPLSFIILLIMLPQINITDYPQSTVTSKFIVFTYSCFIILSVYIFFIAFSTIKVIHISKLDAILLITLSYISLNRYIFQADYNFSIRYMELLGLGVLYVIIRSLPSKNHIWFLLAIVISGIIQAIYGNLQLLDLYESNHSGFRLTGSFFNPGPYAGFLAAVWPITLGMYLFNSKIIKYVFTQVKSSSVILHVLINSVLKYTPFLGAISIILVIPATQSRGAWLAILLSSIILIELRYRVLNRFFKTLNNTKKSLIIILTISLIGIGVFGIYHLKKGSSDGRLFIWKVSTEIIKDNPVFGVGFNRFKTYYMDYQANHFAKYGETQDAFVADNTNYAFNEFIQFVIENGTVGFVLLITVLYFIFTIFSVKKYKYLNSIVKISLLAIGVFAFFSYTTEILPIKLILVVLLAMIAKLDCNKITILKAPGKRIHLTISKTFIVTGILVFTAIGIRAITSINSSLKTWKLALNSSKYGDYESALKEYETAYPEFKNNGEFLMNYGKALSIYGQNKNAVEILKQAKKYLNTTIIETTLGDAYKNLKQYKKAETAYKHAANMIPTRFYPLYLLAKLYELNGEKEKAVAMANIILNKDIKVASTAIKEIKEAMKDIITHK